MRKEDLTFIDRASDLAKFKTGEGQRKCGEAITKAIAEVRGAKRKATSTDASGKLHKVQTGAFASRENAECQLAEVRKAGFKDSIIVTE